MRAAQKDDAYATALAEAVADAVRRLLGPAAALAWARETRLVADLLYHGLTTGRGLATLGEEYCDLLQATAGAGGRAGLVAGPPPGAVRRGVLALLKAVGPYAAGRAGAAAARAAALEAAGVEEEEAGGEEEEGVEAIGAASTAGGATAHSHPHPRRLTLARARAAALAARRALAPSLPTLSRAHLAAFYLTGAYYSAAHRAAGVRHVFVGRPLGEGRPSFSTLGVFLLVQLGVSGALAAKAMWDGPAKVGEGSREGSAASAAAAGGAAAR